MKTIDPGYTYEFDDWNDIRRFGSHIRSQGYRIDSSMPVQGGENDIGLSRTWIWEGDTCVGETYVCLKFDPVGRKTDEECSNMDPNFAGLWLHPVWNSEAGSYVDTR